MNRRQLLERAAALVAAIALPSWLRPPKRSRTHPVTIVVETRDPFTGDVIGETHYVLQMPDVLEIPIYYPGFAEGRSPVRRSRI